MRRLFECLLITPGIVVVALIVAVGVLFGSVFMGMRPVPEAFEHNGVALVRDGFTTV